MKIGPDAFAAARALERRSAEAGRTARRAAAALALEAAREALIEDCAARYRGGAGAATRDSDRLEAVAERLARFLERETEALDRLEVATDVAAPAGGLAIRRRARIDADALADAVAAAIGESILSGPGQAVLAAAVRSFAM